MKDGFYLLGIGVSAGLLTWERSSSHNIWVAIVAGCVALLLADSIKGYVDQQLKQ